MSVRVKEQLFHYRGNKKKLAKNIISYFPPHNCYIEMFLGTGAVFFHKSRSRYNILNDKNDIIPTLYLLLQDSVKRQHLLEVLEHIPYSDTIFNWIKHSSHLFEDEIMRVVRFLYLNNFSYLSLGTTIYYKTYNNSRINLISRIKRFSESFSNVQFMSKDFRDVLNSISVKKGELTGSFIYADPPYLDTDGRYEDNVLGRWHYQDTLDLFELLANSGLRFAISEFDSPRILDLASKYGLAVHVLGERLNLLNRRTEILITNYVVADLFSGADNF